MNKLRFYLKSVLIIIAFLTLQSTMYAQELPEVITADNICDIDILYELKPNNTELNSINELEFDSTGMYLGYIASDEFAIWNVPNQTYHWRLPIISGSKIAFSNDARITIVANLSVYTWKDVSDINQWDELKGDFGTRLEVRDLKYSDTSELITINNNSIDTFERSTETTSFRLKENDSHTFSIDTDIREVLISPDSTTFAILGMTNGIQIVDSDGELLKGDLFNVHSPLLRLLTFSPTSQLLVNRQSSDGEYESQLVISDLQGEIVQEYSYDFEVIWTVGAFSPKSNILVLANAIDDSFYFYQDNYSNALCQFDNFDDEIRTISFSPDGTLLAAGGIDGIIRIWGIPSKSSN